MHNSVSQTVELETAIFPLDLKSLSSVTNEKACVELSSVMLLEDNSILQLTISSQFLAKPKTNIFFFDTTIFTSKNEIAQLMQTKYTCIM